MERTWKSGKTFALLLTLTTFTYVGYIISQKGRYQTTTASPFIIIDTQTGIVKQYNSDRKTFLTIDFKNQTFKESR